NCENCSEDCGTCYTPPNITGTIISEKIIDATPTREQIHTILPQNNLEQLLQQALAIQPNYSIERKIIVSQLPSGTYRTTIILTVSNLDNLPILGIALLEIVPKRLAYTADEISTDNEIFVLESDPLIEFVAVGKLGEKTSFAYSVDERISDNVEFEPAIVLNQTVQQDLTCVQGCDDGNPCTSDKCISDSCAHFLVPDGESCGYAQECQAGICIAKPTQPYKPKTVFFGIPIEIIGLIVLVILFAVGIGSFYAPKRKK
ncbi:MAG: hypothetical protein JW772_01395, partial [Candidatus Diapherotrites archaeon]|nr:hypothetical protein [Candidatus Diapherotrites archaeon]